MLKAVGKIAGGFQCAGGTFDGRTHVLRRRRLPDCVIPVKTGDGWEYQRTCTEGPVFDADKIVWEEPDEISIYDEGTSNIEQRTPNARSGDHGFIRCSMFDVQCSMFGLVLQPGGASMNLSVQIGKLTLQNPVMVASGTFGYGVEYAQLLDLNQLGAVVVKGIRLHPVRGNATPRTVEVASGLINAIGLQGPGVDGFIKKYWPFLKTLKVPDHHQHLGHHG